MLKFDEEICAICGGFGDCADGDCEDKTEPFTRWTLGGELVPDERSPNYEREVRDWNACQICDEVTPTGDRVYEWIPEESRSVRMCSPCWRTWKDGRLNMDRLLDNALIVVALLNGKERQ